jgi:hypothetical protein
MTRLCRQLDLTLVNHFGLVDHIAPEPDVVLLPHSLLTESAVADLRGRPYRAIRMIRDPRSIWVSGYLYHRHCAETWCTNADTDPVPPIRWPQVDYSFEYRPEEWKCQYLERLNGKSYQQNLCDRDVEQGLDFELDGYTSCTLDAMRKWNSYEIAAADMKLEAVTANFDGAMLRIFEHFGFTPDQSLAALDVARLEDVRRMDEAVLALRPQVHSRELSKWSDLLKAAQVARFEAGYGDLILELGYELAQEPSDVPKPLYASDSFASVGGLRASEVLLTTDLHFSVEVDQARLTWPSLGEQADPTQANMDAGVWLSADDITIRPMVSSRGIYCFVVPAGVGRVRLESHREVSVDPRAPYLGQGRSLGARVSAIVIRSRTGEVVIPADDPRLITGWHEVEHSGHALWRWTDGSAVLPWAEGAGPTVVTVRCPLLA